MINTKHNLEIMTLFFGLMFISNGTKIKDAFCGNWNALSVHLNTFIRNCVATSFAATSASIVA